MKTTRLTRIALITLGVALLAWIVLGLVFNPETKTASAMTDDKYCPECGHELPRGVIAAITECPFCKAQGKDVKIGRARGDGSRLRGPVVPAVLGSAAVVLLAVHVVFLVRHRTKVQQEETLFYINCRKCARKIRYRERQIGQIAKCPLCRTLIRFPEPDVAPKSRWPGALLGRILGR
jgi:hypothetical protein